MIDTELARTFLTAIAAGNFKKASERLHLTQSTISVRIHLLEEQLGCRLFIRNKGGTALTPAGWHLNGFTGDLRPCANVVNGF